MESVEQPLQPERAPRVSLADDFEPKPNPYLDVITSHYTILGFKMEREVAQIIHAIKNAGISPARLRSFLQDQHPVPPLAWLLERFARWNDENAVRPEPEIRVHTDHEESKLVCSECGDECVHICGVDVYPLGGKAQLQIDSQGWREFPSEAAKTQRGCSVVVHYACESGHKFFIRQTFHKGNVYVRAGYTGSFADSDGSLRWEEAEGLWRD